MEHFLQVYIAVYHLKQRWLKNSFYAILIISTTVVRLHFPFLVLGTLDNALGTSHHHQPLRAFFPFKRTSLLLNHRCWYAEYIYIRVSKYKKAFLLILLRLKAHSHSPFCTRFCDHGCGRFIRKSISLRLLQ